LAVVLAAAGFWLWHHLLRVAPRPRFATPAEQFLHGALSRGPGFPVVLWEVLPEVFADRFPAGRPADWSAFGLHQPAGAADPAGFARRVVGFDGLTPNCALCHAGTYRPAPDAPRVLVPGAPAGRVDFEGLQHFLTACLTDPRFNADTLLAAAGRRRPLGLGERVLLRWAVIPAVRRKVAAEGARLAYEQGRPAAGPGRADAFNRLKTLLLDLPYDGSIGTSDFPPLWDQAGRAGHWLHWNGSGHDLRQENLLSLLPTIGAARAFDAGAFADLTNFLWTLRPPAWPLGVDAAQAEQGRRLFAAHCAECHAPGGGRTGGVTAADEAGTDPHFLAMWTDAAVAGLRRIDEGPFRFTTTRRTNAYANVLLDGVWLRAPYLHNGSVPTVWDLLQPPARRPQVFFRGHDVLDAERLGFVAHGPAAEREGFRFDTALPGNGNGGHAYGTELPEADRRALVEFLKTL
jgi:mono/diheme cytochrome c family protein